MSEKLPHGWTTAELQDVCSKVQDGTHFSPKNQTRNGDFRYITAKNIKVHGIDLSDVTYISKDVHREIYERCNPEKGDVLYIKDGATTGIATVNDLEEEFSLLSSVALLKPNKEALNAHYLKWYLNSPAGFKAMTGQMTGSAITRLVLRTIRKSSIPLAPIGEQRRIVAKLKKLLGRVDACQQRLTKIPLLLKRFRQSVLTAACSGRLTADWREENDTKQWERTRIDAVCEIIGGSQPPKKHFIYEPRDGYIRFIQIRDYKSDNHLTFIPRELARRFCSKTDVMIGRYGPPLFQILRGIEGAYNVALMKAVPKSANTLLNDYLFILLQDPPLKNYIINASERTVGQDGVRKDLLEEYEIELPALAEQQEIARRVEALVALADQIEARYAKAKAHVEKLTPSLLARAFRGELVPQDPNDEPASVLLERIRSQRQGDSDSNRKRKRAAVETVW